MEKIGAVTITFNSASVIEAFLNSLKKQDYGNITLYVVDNASSDNTLYLIQSNASNINLKIIKNSVNNGVARGNNQGIKAALDDGCEFIVLINNDTEFEPTLISKLYKTAKEKKFSVVVPKMMYYSDPEIIWFAGGGFRKWHGYMNYHTGMGEKDDGQYTDQQITYAPTCCALINKLVFSEIGLMDEKYFVYFDDTDFWYRMMKNGKHKMFYINDVVFLHKVGSMTKTIVGSRKKFKIGNFSTHYMIRNQVYFLKKQRKPYSYIYILWFWCRIKLRFFMSGKYNVDFKTFKLIETSFWEGLFL